MTAEVNPPVLVGHPFIPTGRGEDVRSAFRSFQAAGLGARIRDVSAPQKAADPEIHQELTSHLVDHLSARVNVFYLNGDEVEKVLNRIGGRLPAGAYHVICPQWELSIYPGEWRGHLDQFDEVWTPSRFVFDAVTKSTTKPVFHLPLSVGGKLPSFLGRRYFDLPESAYLFLFAFDLRSYLARKNPLAVIEAFGAVCARKPVEDMRLVIKLHGIGSTDRSRPDYECLRAAVDDFPWREKIIMVSDVFTDNEAKNLVRCCDCFVSLHRSEGFGRGMAEAMLFGKPVVATGYSGNLDFMNQTNSCLVDYTLVDVPQGSYPHARGQSWAEPDVDHAVWYMLKLLNDKHYGRELGRIASRHIRTHFSPRAVGLKYRNRIAAMLDEPSSPERRASLQRAGQTIRVEP